MTKEQSDNSQLDFFEQLHTPAKPTVAPTTEESSATETDKRMQQQVDDLGIAWVAER